jgi:hypothetical protein
MRHAFHNGIFKERDKNTIKNLGKYDKKWSLTVIKQN